jgi:hypothetical protein
MSTVGWGLGRKVTLTIASAGTDSDVLDLSRNARGGNALRSLDITIEAPAALTGTVKPYVCSTEGGTYVPLQSGGLDITIPAGKATPLVPGMGRFLKLVSSGAEGADRAFILTGTARNIGR